MRADRQGNDWVAIGAYALLAATSQLLWLTYAPITTESATHFGVSEDAVGWLAEIFPLLYVVLAIPAGLLLDRWLRQTLLAAAALMLCGATVRLADDRFAAAMFGQILIAVAQPAVLAAVTKLAAERIAPARRALAISIGSAGAFAGLVLALVLGASVGARDDLGPLLLINLVVAAAAALATVLALRRPAAHSAEQSVALGFSDLRRLYTDPVLSRLGAMVFLGMGVFNAVATWLEVLLHPSGIPSSSASWILVAMALAGVVGAVTLPPLVARRGTERGYLQLAGLVGAIAVVIVPQLGDAVLLGATFAVAGVLLLAAQPVVLELSERRAGLASASAAGAVLLAGNLGGIVLAVLVQSINSRPTIAFIALAVSMLLIAPIARSLPKGFNARRA